MPCALFRAALGPFIILLASLTIAAAAPLVLEVARASVGFDQRTTQPVIDIVLAPAGAAALARFTTENVGRAVDIRVDGKSMIKPVVREPVLAGRLQISGMTADEARALAARLSAGNAKLEIDLATD